MSDYTLTLKDKKTGEVVLELDQVKFNINFQNVDHPHGLSVFSSMTVYGVEKKTCNHDWEIQHGLFDTFEMCKICSICK